VPGLTAGFLALLLFSDPAVAGVWTLACLAGVDNDPLPDICAVVDPSGKDAIRDARQKWLERNQHILKDVRSACDARLRRAYGNDEARIRTAKAEMAHYVSLRKQELLSDPQTASNCRAYASALAQGGPKIDYTPEWIKAIEDSPIQLPDFSKR
jgi:hypothetical protein